jgi:alkylation response protein AidB-like acyl-CoA dehydrogenase
MTYQESLSSNPSGSIAAVRAEGKRGFEPYPGPYPRLTFAQSCNIKHGTDRQKEKYLRPLVQGQIRSCFAMTEPGYPGSNPTWMGTTAVKDGDLPGNANALSSLTLPQEAGII